MTYHVEFTDKAKRELKKLDTSTRIMIAAWIRKNLEGCSNPRQHGKGLTANRKGQWRYRIGDYRLICDVDDGKILILILTIGHRRDVY